MSSELQRKKPTNSYSVLRNRGRGFRLGGTNALRNLSVANQASVSHTPGITHGGTLAGGAAPDHSLKNIAECLEILDHRLLELSRVFGNRSKELSDEVASIRGLVDRTAHATQEYIQKLHESFVVQKQETTTHFRDLRERIAQLFENEARVRNAEIARLERNIAPLARENQAVANRSELREVVLDSVSREKPNRRLGSGYLSLVTPHPSSTDALGPTPSRETAPGVHQNVFFGLLIFMQLTLFALFLWDKMHPL